MRRLGLILMVAGCSSGPSDPCAGHAGPCIAAEVSGNAKGLDQLLFTLDQPAGAMAKSPNPPSAFDLPIQVALFLPPTASGTLAIGLDGLSQGQVVAHDDQSATLSTSGHTRVKFRLDTGTGATDDLAGRDLAGLDLAGSDGPVTLPDLFGVDLTTPCGPARACVAGDNCCPKHCSNAVDTDCTDVCGDSRTDGGTSEACDDGNLVNGDKCDPTCQFTNLVQVLGSPMPSPIAGGHGYADLPTGPDSRFINPTDVASDGVVVYVADDTVVRQVDGNQNGETTTLAGAVGKRGTADNAVGSQARFTAVKKLAVSGTSLYVLDAQSPPKLRMVDLNGNHPVSTLATLADPAISISISEANGNLVILDGNGLSEYSLAGTKIGNTMATMAQMTSAAGSTSCSSAARMPNNDFVATPPIYLCQTSASPLAYMVSCGAKIMRVCVQTVPSNPPTPTVNLFAGTGLVSCVDATRGASTFTTPTVYWDGSNSRLQVVDTGCHKIRTVDNTNVVTYAGDGTPGYADVNNGSNYLSARLFSPVGLADAEQLYVTIDQSGQIIRSLRDPSFGSFTTATMAGSFRRPTYGDLGALVSDGTYLYGTWTDAGQSYIAKISIATGALQLLGNPSSDTFSGITLIGGVLYYSRSEGTIWSINTDGTGATQYAGKHSQLSPATDGVRLLESVMNPGPLTTDGTNLYFADYNNLLRRIDPAGNVVTLAGDANATEVKDGTGTGAHFKLIGALTSDGANLYFLDGTTGFYSLVVRQLVLGTNQVITLAGQDGMSGFADGTGASVRFAGARDLATDGRSLFITDPGEGYLYGDVNSPAIRQLDLADNSVSTLAGTRGSWSLVEGYGKAAYLNAPMVITYDAGTRARYVFDKNEGVIVRVK